ncbi:MAG: DUF4011 domain-containing protein [Truepera sp.]|nr:DUF4011 domain-containing protein [Truepera sp.]
MTNIRERNIRIHSEIAGKLNFASHQSAFPLLRDLRIENLHSEERVDDLILKLQTNPAFVQEKQWPVDRIPPQRSISIQNRDLEVDGGFLLNLAESIRGTVTLSAQKDGVVLAEQSKPIELLAYNEWGGAGLMPELLAAFSMPNDPAVDKILRSSSEVLRQAGREDRIDGYESRSRRRVWEMASAIYTAIANLGLTYAVPPASFENDGQKIRLPSQIVEGRVATCLDTAMLFASTFEQAGFNPVIALPESHALVGCWLQPEDLSAIVIDEAETLRKRIDLRELVLIETTSVTSHPALPFSRAFDAARNAILPKDDGTFVVAVDIRRARAHRITPLGLKLEKPVSSVGSPTMKPELGLEEAPALPDLDSPGPEEEEPETPQGRLERWQTRLLDLTLRNRLLNHRATKTSLRIICPEPARLENKLAKGARIQIAAVPQPSSESQDEEVYQRRAGELVTEEYVRGALEHRRVLVDLPAEELDKRTVAIYRKAQTALQEGGTNTLYLALGFLLWKRNKDDRRFRAPLILLPVALERRSVRSGIRMIAHDDEPRFNTTLLEMLRRDFRIDIKGLDGELPTDESGIDVDGIWNRVRIAVKEAPGFEVTEDVWLGHFSFAKYLMWKDLVDRTNALKKNAVVHHLMVNPRAPYATVIDFVEPSELDRKYKPSDLLTPLPADSSQMAAIAAADLGKNFVIIGPPGTGKSQTIANLIAHNLGKGKTVLFVSEKIAALEVVYRRLSEIDLDRFCLELHSNKARKVDVLKQLRKAWDREGLKSPATWREQAKNLRTLRNSLNRVVDHLHKVRRNGLTAHYAIGVKIRDEELAKQVTLSWPTAEYHDKTSLEAMRTTVEKFAIQAGAIGDIVSNPLRLITHSEWTPHWETQVVELAGRLSVTVGDTERACEAFGEAVGIALPDRSMARFNALRDLARLLLDSYREPTASYALGPEGLSRIEALEDAMAHLKAYARLQASLSCTYEPEAWRTLDGEEIGRLWVATGRAWWPKRFFTRRSIVKQMRENGALGKPDPARDAETLARLRQEGEAISRLDCQLSEFRDWRGLETKPSAVESLLRLGKRARATLGRLADGAQMLSEMHTKIRTLLHDGNDLLATEASVGRHATDFLRSLDDLERESDELDTVTGGSVWEAFSASDHALRQIRETADTLVMHHSGLRDWCAWQRRRTEAMDSDLLPLVEAVEQGRVEAKDIEEVFEAAYCTWWSKAVIGEDEVLRTFSTPEHEATITKFRNIDDQFQGVTAQFIAAKLAGKLPEQGGVRKSSKWGGWGVIRHELQKKRRHKPVRRLLKEAPQELTSLTPCFMMSPLSVAQYLPHDQALFDIVIFDEASQITVWDAIGSLARGQQVIVAGDPKQLPPTNFFERADDDPDGDIDLDGDLESILDEMLGAGIPERTLNLHYRSRKEGLIAFSNAHYYDNRLVTFPAPDVVGSGITLVQSDGFYARGQARHNQGEAKAIVNEVVRRLKHPDPAVRDLSIGIVTFNSEQQKLIEDLLDRERLQQPELERAFSNERTEPVFVKNLETVQGDERDTVLFSVTYGPDQGGRVTMNFGPLNRAGGERRLNVAITRARTDMIVFSTLMPDQIDLSRSQARAVADLKHFLEYARNGPASLGLEVFGSVGGDFESPFEMSVARELRQKGWQVRPQIGVSVYRIDLGIVHPDEAGRYLAGVECDGAMYHSSAYARERDKIRQAVLEGLGWKLIRIWSTDWWTNKAKALEDVDIELRLLLEEDRRHQAKRVRAAAETRVGQREETLAADKPGVDSAVNDTETLGAESIDPAEIAVIPEHLENLSSEGTALRHPVSGQPQDSASECAEWNALEFFRSATLESVVDYLLLSAWADVSARGEYGWTPLHLAAEVNDNPAIITALVEAGVEVNARDEGGRTPLHVAVRYNDNPAIVEALLDAGADTAA